MDKTEVTYYPTIEEIAEHPFVDGNKRTALIADF
ncbi:MAG: Fic family protein [Candidatus Micrarchaeota archaeon]|nr:Fic family protein [Candidatus Micrarchaeota archaeon]